MTQEQIENNREFLKDLRANEKKAIDIMRDEFGGRCCLCVAYDTAQRLGAGLPDLEEEAELPPIEIADFYGWHGVNPILLGNDATAYNDGTLKIAEKSHKEIADLFELQYPELKIV